MQDYDEYNNHLREHQLHSPADYGRSKSRSPGSSRTPRISAIFEQFTFIVYFIEEHGEEEGQEEGKEVEEEEGGALTREDSESVPRESHRA